MKHKGSHKPALKKFVLPGSTTRYAVGPRCGLLRMARVSKKMYSVPKADRTEELRRRVAKCKKEAKSKAAPDGFP